MFRNPPHAKKSKKLPSKRIKELAANDYVDPNRGPDVNDSDILKSRGVTPRTSDNESRDDTAVRTLARAEEEESRPSP